MVPKMLNTVFLSLAQARLFWRAKKAFSHLGFVSYRTLFGMKSWIREEGTTTKSLLSLLKSTLAELVLVPLAACGLQITNSYFVSLFTEIGFTSPKDSYYGTLLATVIGAGGLFIGLYYAAISVLGSAIYTKVPNNIRDLLAKEQVGNAYMRCIAVFTYFGVCLLIFHAIGLEPVILAIPLLLLGAGLTIIGFVRLGARAFYLSDPTTLSGRLFKQLRQCYLQMEAGGYRWSDQSFQNHAHRVAQTAIETLTAVSEIAEKEPHLNGHPFTNLCKRLLLFLVYYETRKKSIPTDSLWYAKRYVHPDWYGTGDTETSLARETATGLQPKPVSDPRWIESAILPIVKRCLEINARDNRYAIANELFSNLDAYIQQLAKEQQVESAFNLISDMFSHCESLIFVKKDKVIAEEPLEHMQICQQLAIMPINVLLAYSRTIKSYGREEILQRIRHITWKSEKSIYKAGFAVHVLTQLESLRPRLEFEERVEGRIVSPSWYIQELIAQQEVKNLLTAMSLFYEKACDLYKHWIERIISSKHPWLAAIMISTELEYWNKFDCHINTLDYLWKDLNSARRIEKLPWSSLDIDKLEEKRKQRKKELLRLMSTENIRLSSMSRPESHPDFAGQFLHTVGEALFTAMCENNCDMVKALFKGYFCGSLLQFEQLKSKESMSAWQTERDLKIAVAPLLDLMEFSGYAYLLSDYHDTVCLKEPIVKEWNDYLDQDLVQSQLPQLQFLAVAVSLTESAFETAHRSINRTRWKQIIQQLLKNLERQEVPPGPGIRHTYSPPETVAIHKSPLVRIFARDSWGGYHGDGIDIFLAKYIRQREDGKNLDFGSRRNRNIAEEIRIEENLYTVDESS